MPIGQSLLLKLLPYLQARRDYLMGSGWFWVALGAIGMTVGGILVYSATKQPRQEPLRIQGRFGPLANQSSGDGFHNDETWNIEYDEQGNIKTIKVSRKVERNV